MKMGSSKRCLEGEAWKSPVEVETGVSNVDDLFGMGSNSPERDEALEEEGEDVEGDAEVEEVVEGGIYAGDVVRRVSPRFHA